MDKQFKYAEKRGVSVVVKDCSANLFHVKNLQNGTQSSVSFSALIDLLK
jgi:histidyl-tRNA synthetase